MTRTYMNHEDGRSCLLEAAAILDDFDFSFFLIQGTALGAVRDGGFVPTELDIDFGFLREGLRELEGFIVGQFVYNSFEVETIHRPFDRCRTIVAKKYGCKIDLVGYSLWNGKRFAAAPIDPVNVPNHYCIVHDRETLETYDRVEMFGRAFNVPSPIEKYLELEYGPDWRTPREDHISRTRVYGFIESESVPFDLLDQAG